MDKTQIMFRQFFQARALAGVILAIGLSLSSARAAVISLGTLVPEGTTYHRSLLEMGEQWRKLPQGPRVRIYAGGRLGGESKMVRQMRLGALDAGLLTAIGLAEIESGVTGLQSLPMMIRTLDEVDYVGKRLQPLLEKRLAEKGFVVLFWTDAGWVRFFSKEKIVVPDDMRKGKLFTWDGDPRVVEIWKAAGFNPVPLETANIIPMLDTGLINVVPMPPFVALATQTYTRAPHMIELNWAPLIGALVMSKAAWDRLPKETQEGMRKVAEQAGEENRKLGRAENVKSVAAMKEKGLIVHPVNEAVDAEWRAMVEEFYPRITGRIVPTDIIEEVERLLKEYRAQPAKGSP